MPGEKPVNYLQEVEATASRIHNTCSLEAEGPKRLLGEWFQWAGGGVEVYAVPGAHYTMIRRPNVIAIAETLSRTIGQFQRQCRSGRGKPDKKLSRPFTNTRF